MTALIWALVIGLIAATAGVLTLALLSRRDNRELVLAGKALHDEQQVSAEWRHKYETEVVAHGVCIKQREQEHNLRVIAEAQRNEAQAKCRAYLAQNLRGATKDEINAVLSDLFSAPLSLVPRAEAGGADDPDGLLDPFAKV